MCMCQLHTVFKLLWTISICHCITDKKVSVQSGALDQNLLPDVTVFELDLDEDSDEEILFAKAMPVR